MNRIDRLMGVLTVLQSKRYVTAEQLAQNFEISIRTVYRDVKALSEIGVPVGYENNKGYFIAPGYFLPPVSFTAEEANALVLLDAIVRKFADQSIQRHYQRVLNKVKTILKSSQKIKLENLSSRITTLGSECTEVSFAYLSEIERALSDKTMLQIEYQNYQKEKSQREVEPIGLIFYDLNWHLIAWCWRRNEYRDFKVGRILDLRATAEAFRKTDHVGVNKYIESSEFLSNRLPYSWQ